MVSENGIVLLKSLAPADPPTPLLASEAEHLTWDLDWPQGGNREFRGQVFKRFPHPLAYRIAQQYREVWTHQGCRAANLFLLDVRDEILPGLVRLGSSEDELVARSRASAAHCARMAGYGGTPESLLAVLSSYARSVEIPPPLVSAKCSVTGAIKRLMDEHWWRRALRKASMRKFEAIARSRGLVHEGAGLYVSDETFQRVEQRRRWAQESLGSMIAVNELGDELSLDQLVKTSLANPRNRRCELMARIAGFEYIAKRWGHVGEFYSLTTPSRMHARHRKSGVANLRFDQTDPRAAQEYLTDLGAKIRSKLARDRISVYGFRIAEPHHDGTPHWHFLLFMSSEYVGKVRGIFRRYALEVDPREPGALKHRFKAIAIDWAWGSATGYVAKYIGKNIDGFGIFDKNGAMDPRSKAKRVVAHAATWGIRQFQQIGGPPVGPYRELRKVDDAPQGLLSEIRQAADQGHFGRYIELAGGPSLRRKDRPIQLVKVRDSSPGRYGEPLGSRVVGVKHGTVALLTRTHRWTIKKGLSDQTSTSGSAPSPSSSHGNIADPTPLEFCQ